SQRLGKEVDQRDGDHEARREGQHRVEGLRAPPRSPRERERAKQVGSSRRERVEELAVAQSPVRPEGPPAGTITRAAAPIARPRWLRRSPGLAPLGTTAD